MSDPKAEYELEEHRSEVRRRTKQAPGQDHDLTSEEHPDPPIKWNFKKTVTSGPVESLDSICAACYVCTENTPPCRDMDDPCDFCVDIADLIQTSNEKAAHEAIIKQALRSAAELSILDQEIMSLKAEIKRLQTLTKEDK